MIIVAIARVQEYRKVCMLAALSFVNSRASSCYKNVKCVQWWKFNDLMRCDDLGILNLLRRNCFKVVILISILNDVFHFQSQWRNVKIIIHEMFWFNNIELLIYSLKVKEL